MDAIEIAVGRGLRGARRALARALGAHAVREHGVRPTSRSTPLFVTGAGRHVVRARARRSRSTRSPRPEADGVHRRRLRVRVALPGVPRRSAAVQFVSAYFLEPARRRALSAVRTGVRWRARGSERRRGDRSTRRSSWAFSATTIVDRLMSAAASGRGEHDAGPRERSGRERDRHHVVAGRPDEVLQHLAVARRREPPHGQHASRIVAREHDARRLDRDVGAGADRDARRRRARAPARRSPRRRPSRRAGLAACSSATFDVLLLGQHLGHDLVDAELGGRRPRRPGCASPVIITTRTPSACSASTAARDSGRTASSSARAPTTRSSSITASTVAPRPPCASTCLGDRRGHRRALVPRASPDRRRRRCARRPRPRRRGPRSTGSPDAAGSAPRSRPAATIARASGCSLSASTAAARRSERRPSSPAEPAITVARVGGPR